MPTVTLVLLIIAIVLIVAVIVLYFLGKKAEKKKAEQDEQYPYRQINDPVLFAADNVLLHRNSSRLLSLCSSRLHNADARYLLRQPVAEKDKHD